MGSIYAQAGTSGGSAYAQAPGGSPSVVAPKKSGGIGGFLHGVASTVERGASDLEHAAYNLPGGLYTIGKVGANDIAAIVEGAPANDPRRQAANQLGLSFLHGIEGDLRHPLRHPGNTLLDVLPALGAASRVAEAGSLAKAGDVGEAAKALAGRRAPQPRFVKVPGSSEKVPAGTYSRSAGSRAIQKGLDRLREKYPNVHFGIRSQYQRVGFERAQNERVRTNLANAPAHQITAQARKLHLNKAQRLSIRVVAEGVPLKDRIAHTEQFLQEAEGRTKNLLQKHLTLLTRAQRYVEDVNGAPKFKAGQADLEKLYGHVKAVADQREKDLVGANQLNAETAANRKGAPADVIGQDLRARALDETLSHTFYQPGKGEFFISYRNLKNPKRLDVPPQIGVQNQIGIPRRLSETTHEFTGNSIRAGNVNPDTVRQVAEDSMRANRILSVWRQRDELSKFAKEKEQIPVREAKNYIPIRPVWLKNRPWPKDIRAAIDKLDKGLNPEEEGPLLKRIHEFMFPKESELSNVETKNVKWIDKRFLDNTNRPSPAVGLGSTKPMKVIDSINQAERAAILFKPAYVLPNLGNNLALNLVQQGFAAIPNLTRAAKLNAKLGVRDVAKIDALMGEGVVRSLGNEGVARSAQTAVQGKLGALVDVIPRRASWLHEAAREGFKTPEQIRSLLGDKAHEDALIRVTRNANGEIIDYGRLGPLERDAIRRLLFLYPWVKGATVYGGRFLREHPTKAAAAGQIGRQGYQQEQAQLGPLPSYLQGLFQVGGSSGNPEIVNPASLNNFGTPAQVLATAIGLAQHNPGEANTLSQFLVPALAAERQGSTLNRGSALGNYLTGLYATLPPYVLAQRLINPPAGNPKRIYPYTRAEAILQYLVGSPSPHRLNKSRANAAAYAEAHPRP